MTEFPYFSIYVVLCMSTWQLQEVVTANGCNACQVLKYGGYRPSNPIRNYCQLCVTDICMTTYVEKLRRLLAWKTRMGGYSSWSCGRFSRLQNKCCINTACVTAFKTCKCFIKSRTGYVHTMGFCWCKHYRRGTIENASSQSFRPLIPHYVDPVNQHMSTLRWVRLKHLTQCVQNPLL